MTYKGFDIVAENNGWTHDAAYGVIFNTIEETKSDIDGFNEEDVE